MIITGRRQDERMCRGCGCTEGRACPGGCSWVLMDLDAPTGICSACAERFGWDQRLFFSLEEEDA